MTELSPQAQAVLDAFLNGYICKSSCNVAFEADRNGIAAALRVAADQLMFDAPEPLDYSCKDKEEFVIRYNIWLNMNLARKRLLAIANELENSNE
jgi:hypothetical protein